MTPDEAKRLGLEQVGWRWIAADGMRIGHYYEGDKGDSDDEPIYRIADPAALVEALADRDVWMNAVADVVEPYGFNREAASGPSDLLPGLRWLVEERDALRAQVQRVTEALDAALALATLAARAALSATQETP